MAILMESSRITGIDITGGAIDIMKCFDQIPRSIIRIILIYAGMPKSIVDAYMRFHAELLVYNYIAGGYGTPYHKRCSIPQGCPLSMMLVALLLRPIVLLTQIPGKLVTRRVFDHVLCWSCPRIPHEKWIDA